MSVNRRASVLLQASSLLTALLCCTLARATIIVPGDHDVPIKDVAFDFDRVAQAQPPRHFSFEVAPGEQVEGDVRDAVLKLDSGYGFETQLSLTKAPAGFSIDTIERTNYAGFMTDARPEEDVGGPNPPKTAGRSAGSGSTVQFDFLAGEKLTVGELGSSSFFAILTDATDYAEVGQLRFGSGGRFFGPITVFSPIRSAVPEPQQWLTLLAGAGLLCALIRLRS